MTAAADPPNLQLLIKLMKLTASSNDSEALSAIRKANEQLLKFGGDWEKLLLGKVTIIADPFTSFAAPPKESFSRQPDAASVSNRPTRRPAPPSPPHPWTQSTSYSPPIPPTQKGYSTNNYTSFCYCCGDFVNIQAGFLFKPSTKFEVVCTACNSPSVPTPKVRAKRKAPSTTDIFANL